MLNIVCVNADNYLGRGAEYVNTLYDMVRRNLNDSTKGRFICFTDTPDGINSDIEIRSIPDNLVGWWAKLYLFKKDLFPVGERVIYLDLDTVIVGGLDKIFSYNGDFAVLRDFYEQDKYGSAFMSWRGGENAHIWDMYADAGYPSVEFGDQGWIEMVRPNADRWQDLFPKAFVSYKADCQAGIPRHSKIVCFHGLPRPHEIDETWVKNICKIGGGSSLDIEVFGNTPMSRIIENIDYAMHKNLPILEAPFPKHDKHAAIVGGGPSVRGFVDELKYRKDQGQSIVALNNSWHWLSGNGIKPDMQVMLDARPDNSEFVPDIDMELWYASQCHSDVIDKGKNITLWHALVDELTAHFQDRNMFWVGSGTTVGIRSILLLYVLGYRNFHIYGYDSCYFGDEGHAYPQALNRNEKTIEVDANGRKFIAAPWMVKQTEEFLELMAFLTGMKCTCTIHGDGLLQHAVNTMLVPVSNNTLGDYKKFWETRGLDYITPAGMECPEGFYFWEIIQGMVGSGNVLEIGSGTGRVAKHFKPEKYLGIDINESAVKQAYLDNPEHSFKVVDIDDPLPTGSDNILLYTVALHIPDCLIEDEVGKWCSVTDAVIIAECMSPEMRANRKGDAYDISNQRSLDEYKTMFRKHGFEPSEVIERPYAYYSEIGLKMTFAKFTKTNSTLGR